LLPLGHVATGLATNDLLHGDGRWAVFGSQLPDLIDKPLAWVFSATESSRFMAHTLIMLGGSAALVLAAQGPAAAKGFLCGYGSHLLADQVFGGKVPFFWPFKRYKLAHKKLKLRPRAFVIEGIAVVYLGWRYRDSLESRVTSHS
jgi:membrane-bound metal-dependent hydrolase YbcI (DUF457 family)